MAQEQNNPEGHTLRKIPIPSPRHISSAKTSLQMDQSDCERTVPESDRPDSPCNPDRWTSCSPDGGEQSPAALTEELDYLRQTNKKLQEDLMNRERELETRRLNAELQEQASQARIAERTAALVEEVYRAQRERDEAVMARLRLANEERDEALLRVQHLQMFFKELEDINPEDGDTTIQDLLARMVEAEGGVAIHHSGELILEHIRKSRERRELITAEEMGVVIQERDSARTQETVSSHRPRVSKPHPWNNTYLCLTPKALCLAWREQCYSLSAASEGRHFSLSSTAGLLTTRRLFLQEKQETDFSEGPASDHALEN